MVSLNLEVPIPLESYPSPVPLRPFSVDEYDAMGRAGILGKDDKVELLEGRVSPKMTQNPPHSSTISRLNKSLQKRLPVGFHVRVQMTIATSDSRPEPDLAVVRGDEDDEPYFAAHPGPGDIGLIVEVADTSVSRDLYKSKIYARAGISHYWIVNLVENCVEIFATPLAEESRYQDGIRLVPGETIDVVIFDTIRLKLPVSEFLKAR